MAEIKVNVETLKANAEMLNSKIQELTEMNQGLNGLLMRIQDSWEGEASAAYVNLMLNYKKKAEQMVQILEQFKRYVKTAAENFEKLDQTGAQRIRGAF